VTDFRIPPLDLVDDVLLDAEGNHYITTDDELNYISQE
jgi:hypothetical protein